MKGVTHNIFSIGVSLYVALHLGYPLLFSLLLAIWLTVTVNGLIDGLGHTVLGDVPVRSRITHSLFTAPLWGASIGAASIIVAYAVLNLPVNIGIVSFSIALGVLVAFSHLLLDALTQAGVYYGSRRIAIAHLRYDNLVINLAFVVLGLLLIFGSFFAI